MYNIVRIAKSESCDNSKSFTICPNCFGMAQITPPVGFNLFVLQGMTGRDILKVTKAALPFFFLMLLSIVIIIIFPQIVTAPVNFMIQ